jgi:hypothetical protein
MRFCLRLLTHFKEQIVRNCSFVVAALLVLVSCVTAHAGTDIRDAPGGKRLLFVDGMDIRTGPGGDRKLFIDGDTLRDGPGGKRLLFIDGDSVRTEPGGLRLLFLDGPNIRNAPGGDRLLFIDDGKDIRPAPGGKRLYFIDGQPLGKRQLVAALYVLKPDLFVAEKKDDVAQAPAASLEGVWKIDAALDLDGDAKPGKVTFTKSGKEYTVVAEFDGERPINGIAMQSGNEVWLALGSPGTPGIAKYEVKGGELDGTWRFIEGTTPTTGTEKLKGGDKLDGKYDITEAKSGDAAYSGTVTLSELYDSGGFGADLKKVEWKIGETTYVGAGFRKDAGPLVVSFGVPEQKLAIVRMELDGNQMQGSIATLSEKGGSFNLMR